MAMSFQLDANDFLSAALLGGGMFGMAGRAAPAAAGELAGAAEGRILQAVSRMAGPRVTGAAGAPGQALRNQAKGATLSLADITRLKQQYGAREYPQKFHVTRTQPAYGAHNAGLNQAVSDAAKMQELEYHNDAIFRHLRPGMTQKEAHEAIKRGFREEKELPEYWDDLAPRREMNVRSDAVHAIRITPDGRIEVKWRSKPSKKNPSGWYTFRQFPDTHAASLAAKELITSGSLGRAVMPYQRNGKPLKFKNRSIPYSWWNRRNYDGAFAV